MEDPDFELRRPEAHGASILVAGRNFGCGSSREHAAWALDDYGFRAILAPSFGDIFRTNAVKTGLAPIALGPDELDRVTDALAERNELTVDLEVLEVRHPSGLAVPFAFSAFERQCLLEGLDDIALTLRHADAIAAYEERRPGRFDTAAVGA
jgi:3-isopropylmalate/(R)-2-methylmalate dehydratase small subunit